MPSGGTPVNQMNLIKFSTFIPLKSYEKRKLKLHLHQKMPWLTLNVKVKVKVIPYIIKHNSQYFVAL